jgi:hypothetical protein
MENWYKGNDRNDSIVAQKRNFNCVATTDIIGKRNFCRLSVL